MITKGLVAKGLVAGFLAVLTLAACDTADTELDKQTASLPTKGYSLIYNAVDDALDQLGNAPTVCGELDATLVTERRQLLRTTHSDIILASWTEREWLELELAYMAACYERNLWPYGTVANISHKKALDDLVSADPDTLAYCRAYLCPL